MNRKSKTLATYIDCSHIQSLSTRKKDKKQITLLMEQQQQKIQFFITE
jgi:hypothetical protein